MEKLDDISIPQKIKHTEAEIQAEAILDCRIYATTDAIGAKV